MDRCSQILFQPFPSHNHKGQLKTSTFTHPTLTLPHSYPYLNTIRALKGNTKKVIPFYRATPSYRAFRKDSFKVRQFLTECHPTLSDHWLEKANQEIPGNDAINNLCFSWSPLSSTWFHLSVVDGISPGHMNV